MRDFVVGNEPNLNRFWLPQFGADGEDAAAPAYVALLAQTYDAIKAVRPRSTVYGGALAPRGGDRAGTIARHALADRVHPRHGRRVPRQRPRDADHGRASRSTRTRTRRTSRRASRTRTRPRSGSPTTTKLVALLGQAFDGTAQRGSTLPILYDEFGVESHDPGGEGGALHRHRAGDGRTPSTRRRRPPSTSRRCSSTFCQPNVIGLLLFHAVDEPARAGWQSGLYYVDGTPKTSLARVRAAADSTRRGVVAQCPGLRADAEADDRDRRSSRACASRSPRRSTRGYTLRLQRIGGRAPNVALSGNGRSAGTTTVVPVDAKLRDGPLPLARHGDRRAERRQPPPFAVEQVVHDPLSRSAK